MSDTSFKVSFIRPCYTRFWRAKKKEIQSALNSCLERGDLTLRSDVWKFEESLAKFVGSKYAVGVASGTDALRLSLYALGIGPGDEVITVANTFLATLEAIHWVGARPVLVDITENELMDVSKIERLINSKTKAILPVQYTGALCQMNKILDIAKRHNLYVVDDYCQALGARGAGAFGILNAVSFNTAKLLGGLCDGGAVTTDSRELYEKICLLRNHWNIHQLSVDRNDYPQPEHMEWAWKSRLSNLNAAFLNVKFKILPWIIARREKVARAYQEAFKDLPLGLPSEQEGRTWQEYHLRVSTREEFADFLMKKGIETLTRDSVPNHKMEGLGLSHWNLPVTERLAKEILRLPLHEWLTANEIKYVIKCVKEFYTKK